MLLILTNGPAARRDFSWMARAIRSLPTPLSPPSRTVEFVGATRSTVASTSCIFGLPRDNIRMAIFLSQRLAQRTVFLAQPRIIELLVDDHPHFVKRKWLQNIVAAPRFHRLDSGLHRSEGGHHDDRSADSACFAVCRNSSPLIPGSFKSVRTRCTGFRRQQFQPRFGIARREVLNPSSPRFNSSNRRILASSSMMRT